MKSLAHIRKNYEHASLEESSCAINPTLQFEQWLTEAMKAQVPEPTAMTLATVGSNLKPSTRIVLLKEVDNEDCFVWFSNYQSKKGQELAGNPYAALQFHWVELERMVRIEGLVKKLDARKSDAYFASRPIASRIGAWASPQSRVIASRTQLAIQATQYAAKFLAHPPRPPHWGGYCLLPTSFEFWQGRPNRLHDRIHYYKDNSNNWCLERLAP